MIDGNASLQLKMCFNYSFWQNYEADWQRGGYDLQRIILMYIIYINNRKTFSSHIISIICVEQKTVVALTFRLFCHDLSRVIRPRVYRMIEWWKMTPKYESLLLLNCTFEQLQCTLLRTIINFVCCCLHRHFFWSTLPNKSTNPNKHTSLKVFRYFNTIEYPLNVCKY